MESREGAPENHPALRLTVGLVVAMSSATFWGWMSGSLLVAGLTLVCAGGQVVLGRGRRLQLADAALLVGIGAMWTGIDRIWERYGIASWARF